MSGVNANSHEGREGYQLTSLLSIAMTGKDRIGWIYLDMAVRAAKEYDALHPYRPTDQGSLQMVEDAVNETLWGTFNVYS